MNTVTEVQMKGPENNDETHPCIVQYILFPPHVVVSPSGGEKDSGSEEETTEGKNSKRKFLFSKILKIKKQRIKFIF